jgi:hypothetical protein
VRRGSHVWTSEDARDHVTSRSGRRGPTTSPEDGHRRSRIDVPTDCRLRRLTLRPGRRRDADSLVPNGMRTFCCNRIPRGCEAGTFPRDRLPLWDPPTRPESVLPGEQCLATRSDPRRPVERQGWGGRLASRLKWGKAGRTTGRQSGGGIVSRGADEFLGTCRGKRWRSGWTAASVTVAGPSWRPARWRGLRGGITDGLAKRSWGERRLRPAAEAEDSSRARASGSEASRESPGISRPHVAVEHVSWLGA